MSPSLPLRLGLIGCGRIVHRSHAPAYQALSEFVHVQALADPSCQNRGAVAELFSVPPRRQYDDCRDMLAAEELDVVVIATPHHVHAQNVETAATAGVALVCEKPLALTLEEGAEVLAAAAKRGTPVAVIHNFLFTPAVRCAREWITGGALGAPAAGRALSLFRKTAGDLDPEHNWRASGVAGGGCLNDTAYHELYLLEALMNSPIRSVQGRVESLFGAGEVDDTVFLILEHESGAVSTLSSSWGIAGAGGGTLGNLCEVHSRRGAVRVVRRGRQLFRYSETTARWERVPLPEVDDLPEPERRRLGHLNFFRETFAALVRGERMLPVTGEHAWHMLALLDAARNARPDRPPAAVAQRG